MKQPSADGRRFEEADFIGGALCLDFVNSVDSWFVDAPQERFRCFADWLNWSTRAGTATDTEIRAALRAAAQDPATARQMLERVRATRDALYRVLQALISGRDPPRPDVGLLGRAIAAARAKRRMVWSVDGFAETWSEEASPYERLLGPVMLSAQTLLFDTGSTGRIDQCPAADCGWLFLDTSKNRSRRWCSMRTCGNLAKAHRYYARLRRASAD